MLCLSEYVKQTVRRHYPLPTDRLATLFNAVDVDRYDPGRDPGQESVMDLRRRLNVPADGVIALMIAQDYQRKGLAEAIGALALVEDRRLVLVVVGKQDPGSYRHLARAWALPTASSSMDRPHHPLISIGRPIFLLPTRHDPCSLVVLEALAMGLPVISTVFNGACEIMTDGRHGRVLSVPSDVPGLARALCQMLDESARRAMSQACLRCGQGWHISITSISY